tara:strand:- start:426 stop:821 length:396 start_codon:yes stop_codon:yes gene_type:complete
MPVTVSTIADPLGTKLVIDVECNATAEAAVTAGATTIYAVECDNTANSTVPSYVKLLDAASVTVGGASGSDPTLLLRVGAGLKETYVFGTGLPFTTNLTFWAVKSPYSNTSDDSNAAVSPASAVIVKILCT